MRVSLVVPVFNEEDAIPLFYQAVRTNAALADLQVDMVFVNDGSDDATESIVAALAISDPLVSLVSFTRNFGKEAALFAGLEHATGDAVIPIDVDLQDPIEVIPLLLEKWQAGADMVLAKRIDRSSDGFLKRKTAEWFYCLHNKISHPKIEENVGDFRLMSRSLVEKIILLPERNLFMKGILSWIGGTVDVVEYVRAPRTRGQSKFNGWKLWNLGLEGLTSFSTLPIRFWTYLGLCVASVAFLYGCFIVINKLFLNDSVPGYSSLIVSILFLGGVQLIGLGLLGEYVGRIYVEVKRRPRYVLKKKTVNAAQYPSSKRKSVAEIVNQWEEA